MGRGHRGSRNDSEFKEVQRLRHENDKLKRQIAKLRKELSRVDIDQYSHLKEIIESQEDTEEFDKKSELDRLKEKWACHKCSRDILRVIIIPRADGIFYIRRCITCGNKTKMKKYDNFIEGIDTNDKLIKK